VVDGDRSLAIFIDFENLALGFQGRRERFDIARVLERLVEKGKIVAKKAYADWSRFQQFTHALHEAAIELIEIPRRGQTGKNSADIRLCVDAMDLAYSKEHIDTFVVLSGDSDFSPLVSKLKELGKHVIGLGMQDSTSDLLRDNCDEFIYYEDLGTRPALSADLSATIPEAKRKAFALLMESLLALRRENKDVLWSSMIKDTMKRKKPSFNETFHGYRTFSELLEDAAREGLLELDTDKRSRTYVVTRFGEEMHPSAGEVAERMSIPLSSGPGPGVIPASGAGPGPLPGKKKSRRRRRRGGVIPEAARIAGPAPAADLANGAGRAESPRPEPVQAAPAPEPAPKPEPAPRARVAPAVPEPPAPEPPAPSAVPAEDFAAGLEAEPAAAEAPAAPPPEPAAEPARPTRARRPRATPTPRTRRTDKQPAEAAETPPANRPRRQEKTAPRRGTRGEKQAKTPEEPVSEG
jgi:uncharacterized protein (TIGR00288 family)